MEIKDYAFNVEGLKIADCISLYFHFSDFIS